MESIKSSDMLVISDMLISDSHTLQVAAGQATASLDCTPHRCPFPAVALCACNPPCTTCPHASPLLHCMTALLHCDSHHYAACSQSSPHLCTVSCNPPPRQISPHSPLHHVPQAHPQLPILPHLLEPLQEALAGGWGGTQRLWLLL